MKWLVLLFVTSCYGSIIRQPRAGCQVTVNSNLADPSPLILNPNGPAGGFEHYLPQSGDVISFDEGEQIVLACPGNYLVPFGSGVQEVTFTCVSGLTFEAYESFASSYTFSDVACNSYPYHTPRRTGNTCNGDLTEIEIGFNTSRNFLPVLTVCFDEVRKDTAYSVYNLTSKIDGYQSGFPRPSNFIVDSYYSDITTPNNLYPRANQRNTIAGILGSSALAAQYVQDSNDYYLARGHYTAKADFVFGTLQRATFYYINVGPQWQTFNGGNWNTLEMNTRDFAGTNDLDLVVYTGGQGVATLPDVNGVQQELYLYVDNNNNKAISVPRIYWKVLHDPSTGAGVAFVGHNNPYEEVGESDKICADVCSQINWIHWQPTSLSLGYSYCCKVDDLRRVVTQLPDFTTSSLLS